VHATPPALLFLGSSSKVLKGRDLSTMGVAIEKMLIQQSLLIIPHCRRILSPYHSRQYLQWGLLTHSNKPFLQSRQIRMAATGIPKLNNTSKNADKLLSLTKYWQC
jgi:hypothetical protein